MNVSYFEVVLTLSAHVIEALQSANKARINITFLHTKHQKFKQTNRKHSIVKFLRLKNLLQYLLTKVKFENNNCKRKSRIQFSR